MKQIKKIITSFTVGSSKMEDNETESTLKTTLQMLRVELQTSREAVLVQIKSEILTSFNEIKTDTSSLSEDMKHICYTPQKQKVDILAIHDKQAS